VMEPLRGGSLVGKKPAAVGALFAQAPVQRTPAEWALRWLWDQPAVSVVLSGMNDEGHIDENIRIAGEAAPGSLTAEELRLIAQVKATLAGLMRVGCTGCGYCQPCPAGVDIPFAFSAYNNRYLFDDPGQRLNYLAYTCGIDGGKPSHAALCRQCGACEKKCPQHLPIQQLLHDVSAEMQRWYFGPVVGLVQGVHRVRRMMKRAPK